MKIKNFYLLVMGFGIIGNGFAAHHPNDKLPKDKNCDHWHGDMKWCQGNAVVRSWGGLCKLSGAWTGGAWTNAGNPCCRSDVEHWQCEHGLGQWKSTAEDYYVCGLPKYGFEIHNMTAYSLNKYAFYGIYDQAYDKNEMTIPDQPAQTVNVNPGQALSTDYGIWAHVDHAIDSRSTETSIGKFKIFSDQVSTAVSVSVADLLINTVDPNITSGDTKGAATTLRSSLVNLHKEAVPNIACIIPPNDDQNPSADARWSKSISQKGALYLYPNIVQAKVTFCVALDTPVTKDSDYQFTLASYSSLEQEDTALYPQMGEQKVITTPIAAGMSLGVVHFTQGSTGTQCITTPLYFKTKEFNDCSALIKNDTQGNNINKASVDIDVSTPNGKIHHVTLRTQSSIKQNVDSVDGNYSLYLTSNENNFNIIPNDSTDPAKKFSSCYAGVCDRNQEIIFSPQE